MTDEAELRREAILTDVQDTAGIEINVCKPDWFDKLVKYVISNAPARTSNLEFSGSDLNYLARVLYAESSGSIQLGDKAERDREKLAILNVNHFRLNRKGYPNNSYVAKSFKEVCLAPGQFESVFAKKPKFANSEDGRAQSLNKKECSDLCEAIAAIKKFLNSGPIEEFNFDSFRGYSPHGDGHHIGRSRFWLSKAGRNLLIANP